jgi:GNAT superfamily N-acetyltransferase
MRQILFFIMLVSSHLTFPAIPKDIMPEKITVDYLKNYPEHVTTCAQWSFTEWGHHTPERTLHSFIESRKEYLNDNKTPLTLLAFLDNTPVGMVSLAASKDICKHLTPWLSTIYVIPEQRGEGIGSLLEEKICAKAREMGFKKIYCFTSDETVIPFYEKHHWHKKSIEWLHNHNVTVMEKGLE